MALITGNPLGNVVSQEELYLEGAPYIYIQDNNAAPLNNPDADGYYWGMTGSTTYPVYLLGCVSNVKLTEGVTMNDVRCDTVGVKDTIQKRDYIELDLDITSLFGLATSAKFMNLSPATVKTQFEKVGMGSISNVQYWMVYAPNIYDEVAGDLIMIHLHKAKFVSNWTLDFKYGEPWKLSNVKIRAYADSTKPTTQKFGVFIRSDKSALP